MTTLLIIYAVVAAFEIIYSVIRARGGVLGRMPDIFFGSIIGIFWPIVLPIVLIGYIFNWDKK